MQTNGLPITGSPEIPKEELRNAELLCIGNGRMYKMPLDQMTENLFADFNSIKEYGACYNHTTKSPILQRTGAAFGKNASFGIGSANAQNDFDNVYPYSHMRRCTLSDNGTVTSYYGDANYTEDGSIGQVMVEIPKFYYKRCFDESNQKEFYYISRDKLKGYEIAPFFLNENNEEVDTFYIGAFEMTAKDGVACSVAGALTDTKFTFKEVNEYAQARGENWHNIDIAEYNIILEMLFMIEWATTNSESVFSGSCASSAYDTYNAEDCLYSPKSNDIAIYKAWETPEEIELYKNQFVGISFDLSKCPDYVPLPNDVVDTGYDIDGNETTFCETYRHITSVDYDDDYVYITFDGEPVNIDENTVIYDVTNTQTGEANIVTASSGIIGNGPEGKVPFVWRGIENPFSYNYTWINGIVIRELKYYVTTNISTYGDFQSTAKVNLEKYTEVGYVPISTKGYISKMGIDPSKPWVMLPTEINGNSDEGYCDNWNGIGSNIAYDYVMRMGGNAVQSGGVFSAYSTTAQSASRTRSRGRLAYRHFK